MRGRGGRKEGGRGVLQQLWEQFFLKGAAGSLVLKIKKHVGSTRATCNKKSKLF